MRSSIIETIVGVVVLIVAVCFIFFGYFSTSHEPTHGSVTYKAVFDAIDGIELNSEVKVGGLHVGYVAHIDLNEDFRPVLTLAIDKTLKLPDDSRVEIVTSGIIGDKFVELVPGCGDAILAPGASFRYTKSGMNLERLVGKLINTFGGKSSKEAL